MTRHAPRSRSERIMRECVLEAYRARPWDMEHVTLEGASVGSAGRYAVNSGWQGIDWSREPRGDNSAIWK